MTGCRCITFHSSSSSGPGLWRIRSGIPILPMSCRSAPISTASSSAPRSRAAGERDGDVGDALGVAAGVVVLRLHRARQRGDRLEVLLAHLFDEPRALERGRELGEDRIAQPAQRSPSSPSTRRTPSDAAGRGERRHARAAGLSDRLRRVPRSARRRVGRAYDASCSVVRPRRKPGGELDRSRRSAFERRSSSFARSISATDAASSRRTAGWTRSSAQAGGRTRAPRRDRPSGMRPCAPPRAGRTRGSTG